MGETEAMRRAIVVFLTCAAGSQAFSAPALRVTSSRAGSAGALCTAMTSGASASRRGFLALAAGTAGGLISPQRALAKKAPPVEVEDLDEVDEEEDKEFQA